LRAGGLGSGIEMIVEDQKEKSRTAGCAAFIGAGSGVDSRGPLWRGRAGRGPV